MAAMPWQHKAWFRLAVCVAVGAVVGLLAGVLGHLDVAFVAGWTATALMMSAWVWFGVRGLDETQTQRLSQTDDPGRRTSHAFVLLAALASLVGVGVLLASNSAHGNARIVQLVLGVLAVGSSWVVVHLIYMLRYASLYYGSGDRGIEYPGTKNPDYQDFAYFAFCLGMTYQVSDNTITTRPIRRLVMQHTLLSYVLGALVVASTVNLVVQIAST